MRVITGFIILYAEGNVPCVVGINFSIIYKTVLKIVTVRGI